MAIYHVHCDIIGRTGGRSATAAAAYRATCLIADRTTGERFDFRRKEKAVFSEILTDGNAPEWATDRAELWNSVQEKENRKNSQFCRSFDIALMKEFDLKTNVKLIERWATENYISRGLVADIAVHAPHKENGRSNENIHAHILIPTRKMDTNGWTEKDREANDRDFLRKVRKSWAEIVNAEFEERGMSERIDERTLEEQGITDREPQQHQGAKATAMERKGKNPDRKRKREKGRTQDAGNSDTMTVEQINAELERLNGELQEQKSYEHWKPKLSKMSEREFHDFDKGEFAERKRKELTKAGAYVLQKSRDFWIDEVYRCSQGFGDRMEIVGTLENMRTRIQNMDPEKPFSKNHVDAIELSEERCRQAERVMELADKPQFKTFRARLAERVKQVLEESLIFAPFRGLQRAVEEVRSMWQKIAPNRQERPRTMQRPQKGMERE